MRVRSVAPAAVLFLTATTISLVLGEIVLRALTPFPISETSNMAVHPDLLYTADPALPEIDSSGFRNASPIREHYQVVAIGDSHTYGSNALPSATWPAQFEALTGLSTYNLGMGGYSVYQYDVLFDRALGFDPEWIIVALYPANDWMPECELLALESWVERAPRRGLDPPCGAETQADSTHRPGVALRDALLQTAIGSALYTLVWSPIRFELLAPAPVTQPLEPELVRYRFGDVAFAFGASRLAAHALHTDHSLPRVAAAYRDGLALYERWRDVAAERGIRFGVLIIPSKERVTRSWALEQGHELPDEFRELTQNEVEVSERISQDLAALRIPFIDALPFVVTNFEGAVRDGEPMYPPGPDGHPYASGYAGYAAAAVRLLALDAAVGGRDAPPQ